MKLYILFPGSLFPIRGMSQVRMLNQLRSLCQNHEIIFSDLISNTESITLARQQLHDLNLDYRPIFFAKYQKGLLFKIFFRISKSILYLVKTTTKEELSLNSRYLTKQIMNIVNSTQIDAFMIHYWYQGFIFAKLPGRILRMIDTHYVVEENIELLDKFARNWFQRWKLKRELDHSLIMQYKYFLDSDLIIVNSDKQADLIRERNAKLPVNVTVNGQDLAPYISYKARFESETAVCFYGALSNQFNRRALQRILSAIYPQMKAQIPHLKLYIIGANPPADIIAQIKSNDITVTGFVDDVKPHLAKCRLMLLPLETGSGFRGRAVEVMALGIPIVGTNNALQSIGFIDGIHGYLAESDDMITQKAIAILKNDILHSEMSKAIRNFAQANFSIEATFNKLSQELCTLESLRGQNR